MGNGGRVPPCFRRARTCRIARLLFPDVCWKIMKPTFQILEGPEKRYNQAFKKKKHQKILHRQNPAIDLFLVGN